MHCLGHQKEDTQVARESNLAEQATKEAAEGVFIMSLVLVLDLSKFDPKYSTADLEKVKGWVLMKKVLIANGKRIRKELYCFPEHLVEPVIKHLYETTHYGKDSLATYVKLWLTGPGISKATRKVVARCAMCQKNNPRTEPHQRTKKAIPRTVPI
ncbi:hypothetical protein HJG60_010472 [Phyllostomus discolor]|uniref:Integrase zinc-binding domain-containing protein n=1 Tax=Phyllostomus discolor TaxID=89673 RepID=A0A834ANU1_9CHIR|nr:hypothetical protein HJG60_010472 [Phyllostomus discolor]